MTVDINFCHQKIDNVETNGDCITSPSLHSLFQDMTHPSQKTRYVAIDHLVKLVCSSWSKYLEKQKDSKSLFDHRMKLWNAAPFESEFQSTSTSDITDKSISSSQSLYQVSEFEKTFSPDALYTLKRLVRGCSTLHPPFVKESYSIALLRLIQSSYVSSLGIEKISFKLILHWTRTFYGVENGGNMKSNEELSLLIGKICVWTALLQSKTILKASIEDDGQHIICLIKDMMMSLNVKSYCKEAIGILLTDLIKDLTQEPRFIPWCEETLVPFLRRAVQDYFSGEVELLAFMILIEYVFPNVKAFWKIGGGVNEQFPLLSDANLGFLQSLLQDSVSAHPRIHFVWSNIEKILNTERRGRLTSSLEHFWKVVVDEGLFCSNSHEKKYLGFWLFQNWSIPSSSGDMNDCCFWTPNMIRVIGHSLLSTKNHLYKIALTAFKFYIQNILSKQSQSLKLKNYFSLLRMKHLFPALIFSHEIESFYASLAEDDWSELINSLLLLVKDDCNSDASARYDGSWLIGQFSHFLKKNYLGKSDKSLLRTVVDWTLSRTFIMSEKAITVSNEAELPKRQEYFWKFCEALEQSCHLKFEKRDDAKEAVLSWLKYMVTFIDNARENPDMQNHTKKKKESKLKTSSSAFCSPDLSGIRHLNEAQKTAIKKAKTTISELRKEMKKTNLKNKEVAVKQMKVFELLLYSLLLQCYLTGGASTEIYKNSNNVTLIPLKKRKVSPSDDIEMFSQDDESALIDEICQCVENAFLKPSAYTADIPAVDVLVDILLSLLSKSNGFYKYLVSQTFIQMKPLLTSSSITLIIQALQSFQSVDIESDGSDMEDTDVDYENDDDFTENKSNSAHPDNDKESVSQLDNFNYEKDSMTINETNLSDSENDNVSISSNYDAELVALFKARKSSQLPDNKIEEWHFKYKILSTMVEPIFKYQPSPLILDFMLPLINIAIEKSGSLEPSSGKAQNGRQQWISHCQKFLIDHIFRMKQTPPLMMNADSSNKKLKAEAKNSLLTFLKSGHEEESLSKYMEEYISSGTVDQVLVLMTIVYNRILGIGHYEPTETSSSNREENIDECKNENAKSSILNGIEESTCRRLISVKEYRKHEDLFEHAYHFLLKTLIQSMSNEWEEFSTEDCQHYAVQLVREQLLTLLRSTLHSKNKKCIYPPLQFWKNWILRFPSLSSYVVLHSEFLDLQVREESTKCSTDEKIAAFSPMMIELVSVVVKTVRSEPTMFQDQGFVTLDDRILVFFRRLTIVGNLDTFLNCSSEQAKANIQPIKEMLALSSLYVRSLDNTFRTMKAPFLKELQTCVCAMESIVKAYRENGSGKKNESSINLMTSCIANLKTAIDK